MDRTEFCSKYTGYGDVCDCTNPTKIEWKAPLVSWSVILIKTFATSNILTELIALYEAYRINECYTSVQS